jgi:hypothetical protein
MQMDYIFSYDMGMCLEPHCKKKPCRNAPNSDVYNGGSEPKDEGVGILRPSSRLVRATVVHIGISPAFLQCKLKRIEMKQIAVMPDNKSSSLKGVSHGIE